MREIKFRVWDSKRKRFLEHYEFIIEFNGTVSNVDYVEIGTTNKGAVLEQYSGLKDKNGVDVYEGDIVKVLDGDDFDDIERAYLEIRYGQGSFYFHNAYAVTFDDVLDGETLDVEVVGNIHQNKNLSVDDTDRISPDDIGNDIHEFLHRGDK